ncbi:MAG: carbon starvation protein A [Candidatus Thermoplasmatota archaeon]|nr:carbon starvation protein A [Candidatus Thermoplasmatota archaeon]
MYGFVIILISAAIYLTAYFFYGKRLEKSVIRADKSAQTPALRMCDNVDYCPANRYVLFGHHFASIAGTGPILGPAMAMAWGWLPGLLWVWLGNVFIGATHDYLALMASVRYDGKSIQWVSGRVMSKRTSYSFGVFIWFTMVLIIAAFTSVVAGMFVATPQAATSTLTLILVALFLGFVMYRTRIGFKISTVIGVILLISTIFIGYYLPIELSYEQWSIVLFFYIIFASSLPVWCLLQPRDYLNSFLLYAGLALGFVSLIFTLAPFDFPSFTLFSANVVGSGNGVASPFLPAVPLIIACGALSGFHSIVGSGTTSKQLDSEINGLMVGYGGMLTEGFLATIVISSIAIFGTTVIAANAGVVESAGYAVSSLISNPVYLGENYLGVINLLGGAPTFFSMSYAMVLENFARIPYEFGMIFATLWVSAFAITSLDTATRLARFAWQDLLEPIKGLDILKNRWVASVIPASFGVALAYNGSYSQLWPAFAGMNQLLASIALMTSAVWVAKYLRAEKKYVYLTVGPALFLWLLVTAAVVWYLIYVRPITLGVEIILFIGLILNFVLLYDFQNRMRLPGEAKE